MFRFCCCIRYFFTWFSWFFFVFFLLLMRRKYLQKAPLTYTFQNQKFTQPSLSVPKCFILYIFNFSSIILLALWISLSFFIYRVIIFFVEKKPVCSMRLKRKKKWSDKEMEKYRYIVMLSVSYMKLVTCPTSLWLSYSLFIESTEWTWKN